MYKKFYTRFLEQNKGIQHFASHSHYYWPDVTRDAMIEYWEDSARLVDAKWDYFFSEKVPAVQKYIATQLHLSKPDQIVFASSTHEFIMRVLSCIDSTKEVNILTSDSEFYSFNRQADRLAELDHFHITKVPVFPFESFDDRFIQAVQSKKWDMIFLSHAFFNSGIVLRDLKKIVFAVDDPETIIFVDGYHVFCAVPVELKAVENRIFYTSGSYKYAQGGEGCCFLHVPPGREYRPINTGWFSNFGSLYKKQPNRVTYPENAMAFAGATIDFTALYRLLSVFRLFEQEGISQLQIHQYIQQLQKSFLSEIDKHDHPLINQKNLLFDKLDRHGHFFTFKLDNPEQVEKIAGLLKEHRIITDYRGDIIRFGFALYHDGDYDLSVLNTRRAYFFDELIY